MLNIFMNNFCLQKTNSSVNIICSMMKQLRHCFVEMSVLLLNNKVTIAVFI